MSLALVLALSLAPVNATECPATKLVNIDLNDELDARTFKRARNRCAYYYPKSPCLKLLRKPAPRTYHAICGKPE